jgi:hypothetical protein
MSESRRSTAATATGTVRCMLIAVLVVACGGSLPSATPQTTGSTPVGHGSAFPAATALGDLDQLDEFVRTTHVAPFVIHSEAEWKARLEEIRPKLAVAATEEERLVLVASLVGLLDTHTGLGLDGGFHEYPIFLYHFIEGWYVIAAVDPTLIGARLVSIGGHLVADVEANLRPLVPHDNETGFLLNSQQLFSTVEYLHGAGIVADTAKPSYMFELADGTQRTADLQSMPDGAWGDSLHLIHTLVGGAPEAVRRGSEIAWTRTDAARRVMLIAVNDYGDEAAVIDALHQALDAKEIDRVVLDIRYLPGGSGDFGLLDALKAETRVNRPGGLTVLIGRENFSIADAIVRDFDVNSQALLVGEPTPARADNFRCDCRDIDLLDVGVTVTVPTVWDRLGDNRPQVDPDIRMDLSAVDFFAGRDPVLDAALKGIKAP